MGGRHVIFLIDTGHNHNLGSKVPFDSIRESVLQQDTTASLADGSGLSIYGSVTVSGRHRNVQFRADILVCKITDDAILGMLSLRGQECTIACDKGVLISNRKQYHVQTKLGMLAN